MGRVMRWQAAAMLATVAMIGFAQAVEIKYPLRPVRMLVSYPPGGPSDLTARLAAPHLSEALGQQFIIDNRGGAGGTLAVGLLTQAAPDGYTLLMSAGGEIVIAPNLRLKLPYDPTKDIIPISRVGSSQLVLVVHPSVPAKSVKELVAMAKAKPGSINFASAGAGSTAHLAGEQVEPDEIRDVSRSWVHRDLVEGAGLGHAALLEDDHTVGERIGIHWVVRDDQPHPGEDG